MIISTIKSLRWTDFFIFAITDPRALYRLISKNDPKYFGLSIVVLLFVTISDIVSAALFQIETPFFFYKITYGWILSFLLSVVYVLYYAAFMDMSAQFLKQRGNIRELISLVIYSLIPHLFFLSLVYPLKVFNIMPDFFYVIFAIAMHVWSLIIIGVGVSEMYSVTAGKALLVLFFPLIFLFMFFLLILILSMSLVSGFITSM